MTSALLMAAATYGDDFDSFCRALNFVNEYLCAFKVFFLARRAVVFEQTFKAAHHFVSLCYALLRVARFSDIFRVDARQYRFKQILS